MPRSTKGTSRAPRATHPKKSLPTPPDLLVAEPTPPFESYSPRRGRPQGAAASKSRAAARVSTPKKETPRRLTRAQRYHQAAALLRQWMTEDPEYDERVGALLERELEQDPIRFAEEFE